MTHPTDAADIAYAVPPQYRGDEYWAYRAGYEANRPEIAALLRELANMAMLSGMLIGEEYADEARAVADRLEGKA